MHSTIHTKYTARKSSDGHLGMFAMKFPFVRRAFLIMKYHFEQTIEGNESNIMSIAQLKKALPKLGISQIRLDAVSAEDCVKNVQRELPEIKIEISKNDIIIFPGPKLTMV